MSKTKEAITAARGAVSSLQRARGIESVGRDPLHAKQQAERSLRRALRLLGESQGESPQSQGEAK